jgi:hypothetical protein
MMRSRALRAAVRLIGPVLLVALILRMKDREQTFAVLASADGWLVAAACLLNVAAVHLKVVRWDVLLRTRRIRYPMRKAYGAFLASLYLGMLTPGRVGDALRVQYLRRDMDVPYAEGLASIMMDRLCDLYVLVAMVAVGVAHYSQVFVGRLAVVTWAGVALTALGPLVLLVPGAADRFTRAVYQRLAKDPSGSGMERFLAALRANVGRSLLATVPLTVAALLVSYAQGYLAARALGLSIGFFDVSCLLAIANLLGLLPVSVSGMGVRELFFALVFPVLGYSAAAGVGFGLLVFAIIYLALVIAGFVAWQIAPPPIEAAGSGASS